MSVYKQCQFNISTVEQDKLKALSDKLNLKQVDVIIRAVKTYLDGDLEEKLYNVESGKNEWTKKIINIEKSDYEYFMSEAEFRCRSLVSLIRYSINAYWEKEFLL